MKPSDTGEWDQTVSWRTRDFADAKFPTRNGSGQSNSTSISVAPLKSRQSLAMPLFFAAKRTGCILSNGALQAYTSQARVVLSGLGADE